MVQLIIVRASHTMASSFACDSQEVRTLIIFNAVCDISRGLFLLLKVNWVKKHGEQYIELGWMILWWSSGRR